MKLTSEKYNYFFKNFLNIDKQQKPPPEKQISSKSFCGGLFSIESPIKDLTVN